MLINIKEITARFSEIDSMGIVWHGHYIKYFEDGREAFGKEYKLHYLEVYKQGFFIPIVKIDCNYKKPILYTEPLVIETKYIDTPAAKIIFEYKIYNKDTSEIYATGKSEQVFLTKERELHLTIPDFFQEWKRKNGILND
ncbi:MAG: acyl-CoA thioesterase [Cytophagaceae bacterium]